MIDYDTNSIRAKESLATGRKRDARLRDYLWDYTRFLPMVIERKIYELLPDCNGQLRYIYTRHLKKATRPDAYVVGDAKFLEEVNTRLMALYRGRK